MVINYFLESEKVEFIIVVLVGVIILEAIIKIVDNWNAKPSKQ